MVAGCSTMSLFMSCISAKAAGDCDCSANDVDPEKQNDLRASDSLCHPTAEEVQRWAESFDKVISCTAGRRYFREFLRSEFSEENMLFWLACEDLKKEDDEQRVEEKARIIYEDYISLISPTEVSLDAKVRDVINRNMAKPTQQVFDDAQLQIYTLMQRDSYPRFLASETYRRLLR